MKYYANRPIECMFSHKLVQTFWSAFYAFFNNDKKKRVLKFARTPYFEINI